ncbi:MAG: hypothetical protein CMG07_01465 [Candidatus Marinimicrobia bacterium]|nr:hypothetical protein [Candidatus Neomarinimicrobiota bacterium]
MHNYDHIIWDWNGTLLDDLNLSLESLNYILKKRNKNLVDQTFHEQNFCFPIKDYYRKLNLNLNSKSFELICNDFNKHYKESILNTKLRNDVLIILNQIKKLNIDQSILSALEHKKLNKMINYYKIDHFFKYVHGVNNDEANGKITEAKNLISLINVNRKKILLVGDTNHDSEVAEVLGIDCILIYSGHQSVKILQKSNRKIIKNLKELFKYL